MAYYLHSKVAKRQVDDSARAYARLDEENQEEDEEQHKHLWSSGKTTEHSVLTGVRKSGPKLDLTIEGHSTRQLSAGQQVDGCIYVDTTGIPETTKVQVVCTQVYIYGIAQVCGDEPGQPLKGDLFDYKKNVKLLSSAIKIVRRPTSKITDPSSSINKQLSFLPTKETFHRSIISENAANSTDKRAEKENNRRSWYENASKYFVIDEVQSQSSGMDKDVEAKVQRDKLIQRKVHRVVSSNLEYGTERLKSSEKEQIMNIQDDARYTLDIDTLHRVRFSITISNKRSLPGSFEHPHFQIRYRAVAVMIYTASDDPNRIFLQYIAVPLAFAPSYTAAECLPDKQPHQVSAWITSRRLDRWLLSTQKEYTMTNLEGEQEQEHLYSWITRLLAYYCSKSGRLSRIPYVSCTLQLKHQVVEPGVSVPLVLHLEQHGMLATSATVHIKLIRQVFMTYSVGELVDTSVVSVSKSTVDLTDLDGKISCNDTDDRSPADSALDMDIATKDGKSAAKDNSHPAFRYLPGTIKIDLSQVFRVPLDSAWATTPEMTRGTFEVAFELQVKVLVTIDTTYSSDPGRIIASEKVLSATAQDKTLHDNVQGNNSYCLKPAALPLIIGKTSTTGV